MPAPADCTEFALTRLKATSSVTDLIMAGAGGIFESGDLDLSYLAQAEVQRRDNDTPTKILAMVIQDAGEEAKAESEKEHIQQVKVWLYDRERGYANIRAMRKQVYLALHARSSALDDPLVGRGIMVQLRFHDRTGHRHERRMTVDYETITFSSEVHLEHG